ncbi:M10 family metallopeptidase C-terminal domain-containing protein [Sphingomonas bacterium]|uniref:M10 family metallopeptidase C-terminal domain-containing protein n=1 Tax=Sphingomonas bacterium TaxID=1895847 RepID=UPI00262E96AC|nr:M10 family metallopeptidase C-terminal domain-containing protein [Sphingomonas bacterium]
MSDLDGAAFAAATSTSSKATTDFVQDGVGDIKPLSRLLTPAVVGVTADEAGDGIGVAPGNPVLTLGAPSTIGSINTNGDQDYYQVTFEAGKTYQIGMYGYTAPEGSVDRVGIPVADAYIEVRDSAGNLITTADGGAATPANTVNSGFDVLLTFSAETTGTYYINARAFDNDPTDGTTGEGVGDYEVFAKEVDPNDPSVYRPYYETDSPLYAIDWGSQINRVNQSVRNPDGNEGTRDTGNAQGTPDYNTNDIVGLDIAALAAAQGKDITGKNVITIYFAKQGDVFPSMEDPASPGLPPATVSTSNPEQFEITAVFTALREFEKVADVVYLEVQDRAQADIFYTSYKGTPGPGVSLLGSMSPPDEPNEGLAQFNSGDYRWNATDLQQGGFSFVTLIHEFGHGHGLAHPHDNGGRSGIMNGVTSDGPVADYTLGDFSLNQAVFTMMSYQDGWPESPYGNAPTDVGYGYLGGLMAFDIAAIQDKYGVNEDTATGDDTYTLKDTNEIGTFYSSIWDGGGSDTIKYGGTKDSVIDLRPATLNYEVGGGGNVSYAFGIFGGYTIANGVTIENATTDAGNDTIRDNATNNILSSGAGADFVYANAGGDDRVLLGDGDDAAYFGAALMASDNVDGGAGRDVLALQGNYTGLVLTAATMTGIETISLLSNTDTRFGGSGSSPFSYVLGTDNANVPGGKQLIVNASTLEAGENLTFNGAAETDGTFFIYGGKGVDVLTGGSGADVFFFAEDARFASADRIDGGAGADIVVLRGNYTLTLTGTSLVNVETVTLNSGSDARFAPAGTPFNYDITTNETTVAAGQRMTFNGGALLETETLLFNGSAETNGTFRIFGGAASDTIRGGTGADLIFGGLGGDTLAGGGGNDMFQYNSAADSTTAAGDRIGDFSMGDLLDLLRIDANTGVDGDQAFAFIGSGAFTNQAGQLRAAQTDGPVWTVSGDVDGDGRADFEVVITTIDSDPITQADFVL